MASATMQTVERDIRIVVMSINSAGQNLASLISPNQEDVTKALVSYSASVDAFARSADVYTAHTDRMGVEGRDCFDEWRVEGKAYVNPQIRSLSEQRRNERRSQGSLATHVSTLQEIDTCFSTDLTPRGVQVMTPVALGAIADGHALNNSLEEVLGSISVVRYELASGDDR